MEQTLYLVLENGRVFKGKGFGAEGEVTGEVVFSTGMTGYLETLTDPSYYGQIIVQTFPLIGNYGVIPEDFEKDQTYLRAYVVREWCEEPSNYRCADVLDNFLKEQNIIGLCGIDTRELTKIIRDHGVMNGKIVRTLDHMEQDLQEIKAYRVQDAVPNTSCKAMFEEKAENGKYKVALWDLGAKMNISRELLKRGCDVITVPYNTTAEQVMALKPDGVMLTNGPGDPADNMDVAREIAKVVAVRVPTFGICMGHQLLALSQGAKTMRLKYGHRGANQPVKDLNSGRVFISSQNHGYAVVSESLPQTAHVFFENANDGTCEGVAYDNVPAFSVQFHPEACAGPHDTAYLFDQFIGMMEENKHA